MSKCHLVVCLTEEHQDEEVQKYVEGKINTLKVQAIRGGVRTYPEFARHRDVRCNKSKVSDFRAVGAELRNEGFVESAYIERPAPEPGGVDLKDLYFDRLFERTSVHAPKHEETVPQASEGVPLAVVERGWDLEHPVFTRITAKAPPEKTHPQREGSKRHGAAALEIVHRVVQQGGGRIGPTGLFSYHGERERHEAIEEAVEFLTKHGEAREGVKGVLMIQAQAFLESNQGTILGPIEARASDAAAIQAAVDENIVVVMAGGNGDPEGLSGLDLDSYQDEDGAAPYKATPDKPALDSGAILVSAADPDTGRRLPYAPFGQRVDCFAWGEDIPVTWGGEEYLNFTGTSGATAIITGIALLTVGLHQDLRASVNPATVRELLRTQGTAGVGPEGEPFGTLPNLAAIKQEVEAKRRLGREPVEIEVAYDESDHEHEQDHDHGHCFKAMALNVKDNDSRVENRTIVDDGRVRPWLKVTSPAPVRVNITNESPDATLTLRVTEDRRYGNPFDPPVRQLTIGPKATRPLTLKRSSSSKLKFTLTPEPDCHDHGSDLLEPSHADWHVC